MKSALLTPGRVRPAKHDPAITTFLNSLKGGSATLLDDLAAVLISRGIEPPWKVAASVPMREFFAQHIARKTKKLAPASIKLLTRTLLQFSVAHRDLSLESVTGAHVQAWYDRLAESGLSPGSLRNRLACVSSAFGRARLLGHVRVNPCAAVEPVEFCGVVGREPLDDDAFGKLLSFLRNEGMLEWLTVAMCSRYAGLRLLDAAQLCGSAVTWVDDACLLALTPRKTGKAEVLPVFEPLAGFLRGFEGVGGHLAPSLAKLPASRLSKQFTGILERAGIDVQRVTLPNGRSACRVSFHSLRHCFCTDLAKRGIPDFLRMKLSAHATASAAKGYDHSSAIDLHRQVYRYFTSSTSPT